MFHLRHRWETKGTQKMEVTRYSRRTMQPLNDLDPEPMTEVLQICSGCQKPRTIELDGHWTMEQLQ